MDSRRLRDLLIPIGAAWEAQHLAGRGLHILRQRIVGMLSANHRNFHRSRTRRSAGLLSCRRMRGRTVAEQAFNRAMSEAGRSKEGVYPLAGKVTIDGQTPKSHGPCIGWLSSSMIPKSRIPAINKPHVEAKKNGEFAFSTYRATGRSQAWKIHRDLWRFQTSIQVRFHSARELHNLYSDPDANAKLPNSSLITKPRGKMITTSISRSPAKGRWSLARTRLMA